MRRFEQNGWHLLLVLALAGTSASLHAQSAGVLELQHNWKLVSADQVKDSGSEISQSNYPVANWHTIRRMPSTVLAALQDDGTYPNLYYGMNLVKEVPQDLWKHKWWYRTTFRVPAGAHTFWIDFPGINYRADIWLNGSLVANDRQVAGMYNDHQFNVTRLIRPGSVNTLAVEVTPEQKIRDVDGVELADSWHDWINWNYLGYKGPLNIQDLPTSRLSANYTAATGSRPASPVRTTLRLIAASTSGLTLQAEVQAGGVPVQSGTVTFLHDGHPLGAATVHSNGIATLRVNESAETLLVSGGVSFVPDRNAGIWKPVCLYITGPVKLSDALVDTELPLPAVTPARLTVYATLANGTAHSVSGQIEGEIRRPGKPVIRLTQAISLGAGETREVSFTPAQFPQLVVHEPDLWWPYTMGKPALYNLRLGFVVSGEISDTQAIRFGIRQVTQHRDHDEHLAELGKGGNFYLQINGRDFLIRGGAYTPDLLYQYDPKREETAILYAKDLGINMLRSEGKIASEHLLELADEAGVPLMYGWMCCNQWERWKQWSSEDFRVADESLRSQILMLRSHAAVFLWANGSDGRPPDQVRASYHRVLSSLHWQNALVDTVSNDARGSDGEILWDGIHMLGPYSWRPPSYWFAERYAGAQGSLAEEGDNENIPPFESLAKFIPPDKLWPVNQDWYFHAGATRGNNELQTTRLVVDRRYGAPSNAKDFAKKAQLAAYENTRAQFEDFAANGWATHKMTIYWMFNEPWPSFFGHLFDYYEKPGGAYFGARKGLRPLSVVFDYYATGDHTHAEIRVVNQTVTDRRDLKVRVRVYDLMGRTRYDREAEHIHVPALGVQPVLSLPPIRGLSSTYFVRCELLDKSGATLVDNVYWQSTSRDDMGDPSNDNAFALHQVSWADFTALNTMPQVQLQASAAGHLDPDGEWVTVTLRNHSSHIAFFERLSVTSTKGGNEILPITYSDNYITVFPGETSVVSARFDSDLPGGERPWLRIEGYNTGEEVVPIDQGPVPSGAETPVQARPETGNAAR